MIKRVFLGALILGASIVALILIAGIYKFNFTNSDIYIENEDGEVVPIDSVENV